MTPGLACELTFLQEQTIECHLKPMRTDAGKHHLVGTQVNHKQEDIERTPSTLGKLSVYQRVKSTCKCVCLYFSDKMNVRQL